MKNNLSKLTDKLQTNKMRVHSFSILFVASGIDVRMGSTRGATERRLGTLRTKAPVTDYVTEALNEMKQAVSTRPTEATKHSNEQKTDESHSDKSIFLERQNKKVQKTADSFLEEEKLNKADAEAPSVASTDIGTTPAKNGADAKADEKNTVDNVAAKDDAEAASVARKDIGATSANNVADPENVQADGEANSKNAADHDGEDDAKP